MRFRLRCWSWVHVSKIRKEMPRDRLTRERATGTISFHVLTDAVCGRVAQLVEQRTENPRAEGSSPPPTTTMMTVPRILAIRGTFWCAAKKRAPLLRCPEGRLCRLGVVFHAAADLLDGAAQHAAQLGQVLGAEDDEHDHEDQDQLGQSHAEYFHCPPLSRSGLPMHRPV